MSSSTENLVFPDQSAVFRHAINQNAELIEIDGLGEVIPGPGFHGADRGFDAAVGGHDHRFDFRIDPLRFPQDLQTVHSGHSEIEQDQVKRTVPEELNRLFSVFGFAYPMALFESESHGAFLSGRLHPRRSEYPGHSQPNFLQKNSG